MKKKTSVLIAIALFIGLASACGGAGGSSSNGKTIADKEIGPNLKVSISNTAGRLIYGKQDVTLSFTDENGGPVDISAASLNFRMPHGSMDMNSAAALNTTSTPGRFEGNVDLDMAGEWTAQISWEGKDAGKTTIKVNAY